MTFSVDTFYKLPNYRRHHTKSYGVHGLLLHYHLQFKPKFVQGKCEVINVSCVCNTCTDHLYLLWIPTLSDDKQPKYHITQHYVYSYILGELNEWNIITLTNKDTDLKYF